MNNFQNKTAVITGAASGIGRALAFHAASKEMRIVLADIEQTALLKTKNELENQGAQVLSVVTDITQPEQLKNLAQQTIKHFGVPDLLFNNAGVGGQPAPIWELSLEQIQWVLNINLMGVIHSLQAFLPEMLKKGHEAHIVNTSSMAGLYSAPYISSYIMSKHAVVALTETLHHDLRNRDSNISVSVLCPGWVKTNILNVNNPFSNEELSTENFTEADARWLTSFAKSVKRGIDAEKVAEMVFAAIKKKQFYIFTHPEMKSNIQRRMQAILGEKDPIELEF